MAPPLSGDPLQQLKEEMTDAFFYRWTSERERAELREQLLSAKQEVERLNQEVERLNQELTETRNSQRPGVPGKNEPGPAQDRQDHEG